MLLQILESIKKEYKSFENFLPFVSELSDLPQLERPIIKSRLNHKEFSEKFKTNYDELQDYVKHFGETCTNATTDEEENEIIFETLQLKTLEFKNDFIKKLLDEMQELIDQYQQLFALKKEQLRKGLFTALSSVSGKCVICQEDIEKGRKVRRLDCDGRHIFCQVCIEGWLRNNNTCPICRHKFE